MLDWKLLLSLLCDRMRRIVSLHYFDVTHWWLLLAVTESLSPILSFGLLTYIFIFCYIRTFNVNKGVACLFD